MKKFEKKILENTFEMIGKSENRLDNPVKYHKKELDF